MPTTDELRECWDLLTPEERPKGMALSGTGLMWEPNRDVAADRLLVAGEDVLLKAGHRLHSPRTGYEWENGHYDDPYTTGYSIDRFLAMLLALRAERGKPKASSAIRTGTKNQE